MKEKLKEKLIPKLKTFVKKRWKLLLIVAGVLAAIAIILNALRYTPVGLQLYARVMPSQLITLYTDYGDFTISNGKQSAVFVKGKKVSGDLPVYRTELDSKWEITDTYCYKYYLCPLKGKSTYQIQQNVPASCQTMLEGDCYAYTLYSGMNGVITLDADWEVNTETEGEVRQFIRMSSDKVGISKWSITRAEGITDGMTAQVKGRGHYFASKNPNKYDIEIWAWVEDGYILEGYLLDETGVVLKEKNGKKTVIYKDDTEIKVFDMSNENYTLGIWVDGFSLPFK